MMGGALYPHFLTRRIEYLLPLWPGLAWACLPGLM